MCSQTASTKAASRLRSSSGSSRSVRSWSPNSRRELVGGISRGATGLLTTPGRTPPFRLAGRATRSTDVWSTPEAYGRVALRANTTGHGGEGARMPELKITHLEDVEWQEVKAQQHGDRRVSVWEK